MHVIEKQVDSNEEKKEHANNDQIGAGVKQIAPEIFKSFMHPIKTDSIVFAHEKKPPSKTLKRKAEGEKKPPHKFQIV